MPIPPGLVAGLFLASSAGYIGHIEKKTVGKTCHVTATADDGPLEAIVTWGSCAEVDIRIMSISALQEAGQLDSLPTNISDAFMRDRQRVILTAWGEFAVTIYPRRTTGGIGTTEIGVSD